MVMAVMVVMMVMVLVTPARSSPVASSPPVLCLLRPRVASARRNTADRTRTQATRPQAQGCGAQRKRTGSPSAAARHLPHDPCASSAHSRAPLGALSAAAAPRPPRPGTAWPGAHSPSPGQPGWPASPAGSAPDPGPLPAEPPRPATGHLRLRWALRPAAPRQRLRGRCAAGCSPSLGCRGPGGGWGGGGGEEGKGSQGRGRRTTSLPAGAARPSPRPAALSDPRPKPPPGTRVPPLGGRSERKTMEGDECVCVCFPPSQSRVSPSTPASPASFGKCRPLLHLGNPGGAPNPPPFTACASSKRDVSPFQRQQNRGQAR